MSASRRVAVAAALICLFIFPVAAFAQSNSAPSHNPGFMLRYTVGPSFIRTGQALDLPGDPKYFVQGPAVDMSLAAGFALSRGFAIHGTALFWRGFNPKLKGEVAGLTTNSETADTKLTNFGIGGGLTTWTPGNMYFSLSVVASMLRVEIQDYRADTKWGIGAEALLGKEWWLGHNVGLGLALAGTFHFIPDKSEDRTSGLMGYSVGPRISLTFN